MDQYTDIINKRYRTWPYGTQIKVNVLTVLAAGGTRSVTLCVAPENNEGYVLLGDDADCAKEGESGIITFTKGGPLEGYWKFKRDAAS